MKTGISTIGDNVKRVFVLLLASLIGMLLCTGIVLADSWSIETVDSQGYVGSFTSLAFDGTGNPAISYYDSTNQDLKYAHWNGGNWNIETVDSVGNVGWPPSLAFDILGNPAIAYYDYDNCYLKYAHWDGTSWDIETVDSVGSTGSWGNYCMHISLIFDPSGNPAIAYYNGGSYWDLKYARLDGTTWDIQTVYDDGLNGGWTRCASLAFDNLGNPAIAFRYMPSGLGYANWGLGYAYWNGASWDIERVDSGYGTGAYASLLFDTPGNPAIAYHWQGVYGGPTSLRYAHFNGATWDIEIVDINAGRVSLAFDNLGNPAMGYCYLYSYLKYAQWNGLQWIIETVEWTGTHTHDVFPSLAFDSQGNPAISYCDATNGDLKFATRAIFGLSKDLDPEEGGLGTVVNVTIYNVKVKQGENVTVNDTLPEEFTYINGTFYVDGVEVIPTVTTTPPPPPRSQVISYTIYNPGPSTNFSKIEFDIKVTKAYWEDREVSNRVVVYNESGYEIDNATAEFTIYAFTDLYKDIIEGPTEPEIGVLAEWKIGMGVTNNFDYNMTDTKITDRFGGDLKIDYINTTAGNYTFEYADYKKKTATVTITNDTGICIYSGFLNKTGVTVGDEPYEFHIFWTGKTHNAHFEWTIGDLASGNTTGIIIGVSTDTNPAGKQEYTSTGLHKLNSGATLKFIDPEQNMQLSAVTDSINVTAVEDLVP